MGNIDLALFLARLVSALVLFVLSLWLTLIKPDIVPSRTPRRKAIVICGSALAALWIADACIIAGRGLLEKLREPDEAAWKEEQIAIILNFLAWSGVVGIGVWKETYTNEIWTSALLKFLTIFAFSAEVVTLALLSLVLHIFEYPVHKPKYTWIDPRCSGSHPLRTDANPIF
ncbi:hypothetical protein DACRYDRAFT_25137 [Dacryopinax primogenitus]|uniref:Uncharacterized protein n=1 Tax=Dacryopinax primogenitus (strain DJM 731) TaxID=1858805 RepID=M5FNF8_DACPD|nr:uncharacterized protein DACRYDRAFT_25137 [Dacryopinax primogenitus]EJT97370.1 hypothetical protein DACRYDRAFT_25137 [Dacryopinax primogenitus]